MEDSPLSEPIFLILVLLARAPRHGYAIMKAVEMESEGRVRLSTGTLYGALARLLEQGWIERVVEKSVQTKGRERRVYTITSRGREALGAEMRRLEWLTAAAHRVLNMPNNPTLNPSP